MEQVVVPIPGAVAGYSAKSALFTAGYADRGTFFESTGTFTITLDTTSMSAGWSAWFRTVSGTQTFDPSGGTQINGAATYAVSNAGDTVLVTWNGTSFEVAHIQRPSTVAITGGTINGTTVGATTATTGRFTTVESTIATGTAPFIVASTTVVANLNVSQLLGSTWAAPGTIGSTTPNTGVFLSVGVRDTANDHTITIDTASDEGADRTLTIPPLGGAGIFAVSSSALTSGRVPFATTNGLLTDASTMTFSSGTLTMGVDSGNGGVVRVFTNAASNCIVGRYNSSNSLGGFYVESSGEVFFGGNINISGGNNTFSRASVAPCRFGNPYGSGVDAFWIDVADDGVAGNTITWISAFKITVAGDCKVLNTTASSSTTTGALIVSGGVGIAGAVNVGGAQTVAGLSTLGSGSVQATLCNHASGSYSSWATNGTTVGDIGSDNQATGGSSADFGVSSRGGALRLATNTAARITIANAGGVSFGTSSPLTLNSTTASTSTATGALIVAGGIGVAGQITFDGSTGLSLRVTNGVANNTVATTLGSVGPTGSTAGDPQGWLRISVAGTDRYIPFW